MFFFTKPPWDNSSCSPNSMKHEIPSSPNVYTFYMNCLLSPFIKKKLKTCAFVNRVHLLSIGKISEAILMKIYELYNEISITKRREEGGVSNPNCFVVHQFLMLLSFRINELLCYCSQLSYVRVSNSAPRKTLDLFNTSFVVLRHNYHQELSTDPFNWNGKLETYLKEKKKIEKSVNLFIHLFSRPFKMKLIRVPSKMRKNLLSGNNRLSIIGKQFNHWLQVVEVHDELSRKKRERRKSTNILFWKHCQVAKNSYYDLKSHSINNKHFNDCVVRCSRVALSQVRNSVII